MDNTALNIVEFRQLLDEGIYTDKAACKIMGVSGGSIYRWCHAKNCSHPNKENEGKVIDFMNELRKPVNKRPVKHPSFGWATPDQIKRLNEIGVGAERASIMEAIKAQAKKKGKR